MRTILTVAVAVACAVGLWPSRAWAQDPAVLRPSETIEAQPRSQTDKPPVITAVAVVPGGGIIATAGDDHVVRTWNSATGQLVHRLTDHADWVRALQFSPDGQVLASAGDDRRIIFWDSETGEKLHTLPAHPHVIYSLAYSPDGKLLATAGFEHQVRVYDTASLQLVHELEGPDADLRSVAFSADGSRLAVAGRCGQVRVWKLPAGEVDLEIAASGIGRLRSLAWLPDGQKLATAGENRLISVWDAHTGAPLHRIHCPAGKLMSMAVCGENLIATGGSDNAIRVWNWQSESQAEQLLGHTGSVASLAFDAASGTIISGSFDTTVRVWKLKPASGSAETAGDIDQDRRVR